jgi:predicted metal-dependent hydrolase
LGAEYAFAFFSTLWWLEFELDSLNGWSKMTRVEIKLCFAEGIRLFNQGKLFDAHEVWEDIWKSAEGAEKTFYQALIQAAAALLHLERGNHLGAISVYLKSRSKLEQFPAQCMGIELGLLRSELAEYFAALLVSSDSRSHNCQRVRRGNIVEKERQPLIKLAPA